MKPSEIYLEKVAQGLLIEDEQQFDLLKRLDVLYTKLTSNSNRWFFKERIKFTEDHIEEYISQEVYVQIAIIKGKEKVSTKIAIDKYCNTNHFRDFSEGKPYFYFIDGLRDKCLGKLKNSPMRNKETKDETIKLLQKKINELSNDELEKTYWEIETGEFLSGEQIKELEKNCKDLTKKLDLSNLNKKDVQKTIMSFCENYEKLCQKKYPEAPLPLEILKSVN